MITEKRQIRREKDRFVCRPSYRDNLDNDSHEETISIVSKNFTGQTWAMEKSQPKMNIFKTRSEAAMDYANT